MEIGGAKYAPETDLEQDSIALSWSTQLHKLRFSHTWERLGMLTLLVSLLQWVCYLSICQFSTVHPKGET